ncbi:MAG: hypothetical protein RLZZ230_279 [Candidatus Parcubacteria bacterium]
MNKFYLPKNETFNHFLGMNETLDEFEITFDKFHQKWNDYRVVAEAKKLDNLHDLALEVSERINKAKWLFHRIFEINDELLKESACKQGDLFKNYNKVEEAEILTEALYYQLYRVKNILKVNFLRGFESGGVRNVVQHLLEQPEKPSQIHICKYLVGHDNGPIIKLTIKKGRHAFNDEGLYTNLREYFKNLNLKLDAQLLHMKHSV